MSPVATSESQIANPRRHEFAHRPRVGTRSGSDPKSTKETSRDLRCVGAVLPRRQTVADAHTPAGIAAVGLPFSYPLDAAGHPVCHGVCQASGQLAKDLGLRGVRCRSAQSPFGAGRELAWFPATARSRARAVSRSSFADWFWT